MGSTLDIPTRGQEVYEIPHRDQGDLYVIPTRPLRKAYVVLVRRLLTSPDCREDPVVPILFLYSCSATTEYVFVPTKITYKRITYKLLIIDKLEPAERLAPKLWVFRHFGEMDTYTELVLRSLRVIEAALPWAQPVPESKAFWNEKCNDITQATHVLRRAWTRSRGLLD